MPVSSFFFPPFTSKCVHASQTLLEPALQHFHPIFSLICDKLSWKTSPLVGSEILELFANTFAPEHTYSRHRWEKLRQQVQRLLFRKQKIFSQFLLDFWNLHKIYSVAKKRSASQLKYFLSYSARQMLLLQCPEAPGLEQLCQ